MGRDSPTVYLFAGCSMSVHGGGSTCAQIARAYVRAGYNVIFFSPESPMHPVVHGEVVEVRTDWCDYGKLKSEATADEHTAYCFALCGSGMYVGRLWGPRTIPLQGQLGYLVQSKQTCPRLALVCTGP